MFLARLVGYIALVYGAVTLNAYFVVLGIAAVALFWVWDRMLASDEQAGAKPQAEETIDGQPCLIEASPVGDAKRYNP
jgi:hypothetical protein